MNQVAIVSLGRAQAMGEVRRVASWRELFAAAGAGVHEIALSPDRRPHPDGAAAVMRGVAAPERLAWSGPLLRSRLHELSPDAVVVVSTRAFDPGLADGSWTVVLDHVDSLSRSYRDRAGVVEGIPRRTGYRTLAMLHARVERRLQSLGVRRVAAGWSDALTLHAEWVPNLIDAELVPHPNAAPDVDVLFFGTLRYPPNIEALERLARCWPHVRAVRPDATALVAGAAPPERVRELCREHGWELVADFSSLPEIASRARLAIAPLTRVAGIQNKILDAAVLGLPQVVSPETLEGFEPGLPLTPAFDDAQLVAQTLRILDEPEAASRQASELRRYVMAEYGTARWSAWGRGVLESAPQPFA